MRLIDEVLSIDYENGRIAVLATVRREWCESIVAIELMAQAAAALSGAMDLANGFEGSPRPGMLLGTRKLLLASKRFTPGERLAVTAQFAYKDCDTASFECAIRGACGDILAEATLNAFRPDDLSRFLATSPGV